MNTVFIKYYTALCYNNPVFKHGGNYMTYDYLIIGAGPAGSTLAYLTQNLNAKIAIIDKRNFDQEYDFNNRNLKSCGGLLAPDAQKSLAKLNLNLPKEVTVDPQIFSVKTIDLESKLTRFYQRFYINMNRELFDRFLINQSNDTKVTKYFSTRVKDIVKVGSYYEVQIESNNKVQTLKTRIIIGADGANSKVRSRLFNNRVTRYTSIQKVYKTNEISPHLLSIFNSKLTDYYGWGFTKGKYFYLGMAIPKGNDATSKFAQLENQLQEYGYNFNNLVRTESTILLRPTKKQDCVSLDGSAYLIGEAASFVSPSSAEGISFAFDSAIALFESLKVKNRPYEIRNEYIKNIAKIQMKLKIKHYKRKLLYNKHFRKIVMSLNIQSIKQVDCE